MSADNWAICPRCKAEFDAKLAELPFDEPPPKTSFDDYTFREDYELGVVYTGEFYVRYEGRCQVCGLKKVFKHSEQLLEVPNAS